MLLNLYHKLPSIARSVIASARGYQLARWRYGPESDRLCQEALERDGWSAERWHSWQQEQLGELFHLAATRVPYYRSLWAERRRKGDCASWEILANWPILEKEMLRANARAFLADGHPRRLFNEHTSGSTGKPLQIWIDRDALRFWYALFEARCRLWNGVSHRDRWAILGGQLVVPVDQLRPPFWVWNRASSQLYLSSYHLSPTFLPYYLRALERYQVRYIVGYTSAIFALAQTALDATGTHAPAVRNLGIRVVLTNAEPVSQTQKLLISRAFGCPVVETYGMSEIVAAASECHAGSLHLWPEAGALEILEGTNPAPLGVAGDVVCTGFVNQTMPLVRYRVGDRAATSAELGPCRCGRALPRLSYVEGRIDELLYTADGRRIGRLDPIFKADFPIREAQIIQERLDRVVLRYVPAAGFSDAVARALAVRIRDRLGPVEVILDCVEKIPRGPNGKFRGVLCHLSPAERERVRDQSSDMLQDSTTKD